MKGVKEGGDGGGGGGKVVAGPALFPRLHVAETKKAGPRGPPRNKMALYEQLTIPSHRFKPTPVPLPASSGRAMTTPIYQPQVQVQSPASSFDSRYSYMPVSYMSPIIPTMAYMPMMNVGMYGVGGGSGGGASATSSMNGSSARSTVFDAATESQRVPRGEEAVSRRQTSSGHSKPQGKDEDDFAVPTYSATQASSQTRAQASRGGHHRVTESAIAKRCSMRKERSMEDDASWTSASVAVSVVDDDVITKGRRDCEEFSVSHHITQERKEKGLSNHSNTTGSPEVIDSLRPVPEQDHQSGEASEPSLPRGGSSTETELSMMENITSSSICFRDVVDAFGQQEFWKAQSTIIRQQKLFARQVFELHRVVEVQHLLAKKSSLSLNIDEVLEEEADNVPVPASPVAAVPVVPEIPETDGSQSSEENSRPVPEAVCQPIYPLSIPTQQDYNSASAWQQAVPFGANQWAARMASPFMYVPYQGSCPPGYGVYPTMGGPMPMYGGAGGMQAARFPAWQQQPGMSQPWGMQESAAAAAAAAGGWYGQQPVVPTVVPTVVPSASERLAPSAVNQAVSQRSEGSSREKGDRSSKADGVKSFGWAKGWGSTEERVVVRGESEASKSKESVAAAPSVAYELGRREGDANAGKQLLNADANEVRGRDLESEPRAWPSGASYEGPLHNRTLKRPRADVPDVAVSPWFRVMSPSNRISQQQNGVIKVVPRAVSATPESAASILLSIQKERQR